MTFPQTTPVEQIRQGQEFWRLFTPLESSGDIFEAEVSGRAFVIGAESDIAQVRLSYFCLQEPDLVQDQLISPSKPFIGRLDAFASRTFQTGQRARILFSILDLLPKAGFRPPTAGSSDDVQITQARIDVVMYLTEVPEVIPPRADRIHRFEQVNDLSDPNWLLVPFYGRRYAQVTFKNLSFITQPSVDIATYGINISNFTTAGGFFADNGHQQVLLASTSGLATGTSGRHTIIDRSFDYLAVRIEGAGGASLADFTSVQTQIVVSDRT